MERKTVRKLGAVVAATAAVGLLGTACSNNDSDDASSSASAGASQSNDAGANGGATTKAAGPTEITTGTELTTVDGKKVMIDNEAIAASYGKRGGPDGYLGKPLGPVVKLKTGGSFITFENGSLYQNPANEKVFAEHGEIGDKWGEIGHENGKLGYPTSEETKVEGGLEQTYDHGTISFVGGKVTVKES